MDRSHITTFLDAADRYRCMIGLREPNPLADHWIGKVGYAPKGANIKGKTADNPAHHLAGLVVDPFLCPLAFLKDTWDRAVNSWSVPSGGVVIKDGPDRGLLRVYGNAIHADYDLMALVRVGDDGSAPRSTRIIEVKKQRSRPYVREEDLYRKVAAYINGHLVVRMIQHGPEFLYDGHGAKDKERILWFAPGRKFWSGWSSMPHPNSGMAH